MPHINLEVSQDLLERMRRAAYERGCTRRRFITDALEEAVVKQIYRKVLVKESPVAPERDGSKPSGNGQVAAASPAVLETDSNPGNASETVPIEPPYHADTRMALSDALKQLFPERLQSQIEKSIRNS